MDHMLEVRNLKTQFKTDSGIVQAVDGVSFYIDKGEIVGLVGESGCGKSVSQLSVLQLIPTPPGKIVNGEAVFEGVDLLKYSADGEEMRSIRGGKIGIIFQEPMTSLNPVLTISQQIVETLALHLNMDRSAARSRAVELLRMVGIPDAAERVDNYPHQLSGGMRQRVMIAMALACNPQLLIADEASTALDVTTQAQILELLQQTVKKLDTALLIVTHNLGIVARYAQRIYVMYAGRIVEAGKAKDVFANPRHPYTIGLLKAVPRLDEPKGHKLVPIDGLPPNLINRPDLCAFFPRCSHRLEKCRQQPWPELRQIEDGHYISCHLEITRQTAAAEEGTGAALPQAEAMPRPFVTINSSHAEIASAIIPVADDTLVAVNNLKMYFPVMKGLLRRQVAEVKAVEDVSFKIRKGETLGLVGESGCGKTTVARCILRIYRPTSGNVIFEGRDIARLSKSELRRIRHKKQLVFQDPYSSLDPRQSAGSIVGEPLKIHRLVSSYSEYDQRVTELFQMVGLDPALRQRVPHEFSGGQRQRIGIARALACNPSFIVCDEPISALDVSIQAQIINLLEELQQKLGLTYLFIAHDLSVVRHISDYVAVMYLGSIVEITDWQSLYENPLHPYTRALLSAVPIPDPFVEENRQRIMLKGEVPSLLERPAGCSFHPRCAAAEKECMHMAPPLKTVRPGHQVACHRI